MKTLRTLRLSGEISLDFVSKVDAVFETDNMKESFL
jgi:hypothetical protein